jgi:pilus assembly protein Flp/PilA
MQAFLKALLRDRRGATAIEYGLIAAFVALAIVATLPSIRKNLSGVFNGLNDQLSSASRAAGGR